MSGLMREGTWLICFTGFGPAVFPKRGSSSLRETPKSHWKGCGHWHQEDLGLEPGCPAPLMARSEETTFPLFSEEGRL